MSEICRSEDCDTEEVRSFIAFEHVITAVTDFVKNEIGKYPQRFSINERIAMVKAFEDAALAIKNARDF